MTSPNGTIRNGPLNQHSAQFNREGSILETEEVDTRRCFPFGMRFGFRSSKGNRASKTPVVEDQTVSPIIIGHSYEFSYRIVANSCDYSIEDFH